MSTLPLLRSEICAIVESAALVRFRLEIIEEFAELSSVLPTCNESSLRCGDDGCEIGDKLVEAKGASERL
jgi:hypothetical protein